jgi:uncharacterized protein YjbI with pentapeptide repeats
MIKYKNPLDTLTEGKTLPEGTDTWAVRSTHPDLRSRNGYRWPASGWAEAPGPIFADNVSGYPNEVGDGICVATSWEGMASSNISATTLLLCAFSTVDVLGCAINGTVRVRRAYVVDIVDGVRLVRESGAGAYLYSANLPGVNLFDTRLIGVNLNSARLPGANLRASNLTGADMYGANLSRADLSETNLTEADLSFASLHNADLRGADLRGANLTRANLTGADLHNAHLTGADLHDADLTGADLHDAHLHNADLTGANLTGARLAGANLTGADLNSAIGMETAR